MQEIIVKRSKEDFNKNHAYKIFIDRQEITRLMSGEEKLIRLHENAQFVEARMASGRSNRIAVENIGLGQRIMISGNRWRSKYLKYAGILIPLISLSFILNHKMEALKIIGGLVFITYILLIIYLLAFQRSKWLVLKLED
ncbi:hypothetical protein GCM10023115_32260 [Pontixanthobacter gangjinensis]|uniref:Uncharacterized protein n=1 Tax=Christiangramia aestuarii TaxID=1028746 RepID=A0A7K1LNU8_9FLAO|nr:hypothetical protein [Christiangramia aestuarii]MUP42456.1 hypothetical protein [Christiangramia aestuarii]